jgi:arylsulfatase A-like enzyme
MHPNSEFSRRELLSGYFTAVTEMDRNIGRLIDWLESEKLRENTLIVFTSDSGMNTGHHGIWGKGNGTYPLNMYDTSVKAPLLISQPGRVAQGLVCDELVSHLDLRPTMLDWAGIEDTDAAGLPGRSLLPILRGESQRGHESIVVHDEYGPVRMIRTKEWKYVHRYPDGPHEFYCLRDDPDEERNLFGAAEHSGTIHRLKGEMEDWFGRYADPSLDGRRLPVTGEGQLGLASPAEGGKENFAQDLDYVDEARANAFRSQSLDPGT